MCNDDLNSLNEIDLTNNLFVYNHKSYPTKLRNKIKREIKHMPELVGILNSKTNKNINSKKIKHKKDRYFGFFSIPEQRQIPCARRLYVITRKEKAKIL